MKVVDFLLIIRPSSTKLSIFAPIIEQTEVRYIERVGLLRDKWGIMACFRWLLRPYSSAFGVVKKVFVLKLARLSWLLPLSG